MLLVRTPRQRLGVSGGRRVKRMKLNQLPRFRADRRRLELFLRPTIIRDESAATDIALNRYDYMRTQVSQSRQPKLRPLPDASTTVAVTAKHRDLLFAFADRVIASELQPTSIFLTCSISKPSRRTCSAAARRRRAGSGSSAGR